MNIQFSFTTAALVAVLLLQSSPSFAGRSCEAKPMDPQAVQKAFAAGSRLKTWLDDNNPEVAIVARRGQNLDKYGVKFSHGAFVTKENGGWTVFHSLNGCGTDKSDLFAQGLAEFFSDDLFSGEVAVVIPKEEDQKKLKEILLTPKTPYVLHDAHYSAVSYPFATKYQNSNGWVLETYAYALSDQKVNTRDKAQAWLKIQNYTPDVIDVGALERLGGRMFKSNISFDDHPSELRWAGKITTSTGDSLLRFVSTSSKIQPECPHGSFTESVCILTSEN